MIDLDHEKFEGVKELADIGLKIAQGRATLAQLKTDTDSYLASREEEAVARIKIALVVSQQLITEIGQYHGELEGYRREVETFVDDIRSLLEGVAGFKKILTETTEALYKNLDIKQTKIDAALVEVKRGRALLEADQQDLAAKRQQFGSDKKALRDEWAALERAAAEIKNKKK